MFIEGQKSEHFV